MVGLSHLHSLVILADKQAKPTHEMQFLSDYVCKSIISLMGSCANSDKFGLGYMWAVADLFTMEPPGENVKIADWKLVLYTMYHRAVSQTTNFVVPF